MTLAGEEARTKSKSPIGGRSGPQAEALLAWYDRHRRRLPWRAENGERPDPYRVWLSEIMLQQTTAKAVAPYYSRFLARWPSLQDLASVRLVEVLKLWAGLGYYARARNLHACARAIVARHDGAFPQSEEELRTLPGIGGYTAAAIAAIAFNRKVTPVDGNIERVVARLFAVEEVLPAGKPAIVALAQTLTPARRAGDFAQAMMDLGATICTPKRPACALCPWNDACATRLRGDPETFPRKAPKTQGRLRRGAAFVALRADGAVLMRTRPAKGLLGGMTEVPNTQWSHDFDECDALAQARGLFSPIRASLFSPPPLRGRSLAEAAGEGEREGGKRPTQSAQLTPLPNPPPQGGREKKSKPARVTNGVVWRKLPGRVTHTFTHFPLELIVYTASITRSTKPPAGARWIPVRQLAGEALPSVMRKVIAHALEYDDQQV
jgi:A/G-specific adenine glycosylase